MHPINGRVDFVNDDLYATDCGPQCPVCACTIWLYLPAWTDSLPIGGQCASCHWFETFGIDVAPADRDDVTIGDIKRAHFEATVCNRIPAREPASVAASQKRFYKRSL